MGQTKEGAIKAREAMIANFGGIENYRKHMQAIGRNGGKNGNTGGFASKIKGDDGLTGKQRARVAGAKGGRISKPNRPPFVSESLSNKEEHSSIWQRFVGSITK